MRFLEWPFPSAVPEPVPTAPLRSHLYTTVPPDRRWLRRGLGAVRGLGLDRSDLLLAGSRLLRGGQSLLSLRADQRRRGAPAVQEGLR